MKTSVSDSKDLSGVDSMPPGFKLTPLSVDVMAIGSANPDAIGYATSGFTGFPPGMIKAGGSASDFEEEDPDATFVFDKNPPKTVTEPPKPLAIEPAKADEKLDNKDMLGAKVE